MEQEITKKDSCLRHCAGRRIPSDSQPTCGLPVTFSGSVSNQSGPYVEIFAQGSRDAQVDRFP